jgi:hypothetical protein
VEGKELITDDELVVKKKNEVFERPKFASFTPVTPETFMAWKKEFDAKYRMEKIIVKKELEIKISGK